MKMLLIVSCAAFLLAGCATTDTTSISKDHDMITHSVFFKLNHEPGSDGEVLFLKQAAELAKITGVGNFQIVEETSPKNQIAFGLSMTFADQTAYDSYNNHPDHVAFVQEIWLKEVAAFQEIDHVPFTK